VLDISLEPLYLSCAGRSQTRPIGALSSVIVAGRAAIA
jgi:hypothetical protein